ncbi:oligopeptide transport system ATP-binding protein [Spinactinospora alkalitolerans]|uniref:Oligopeptide transport system ATP-binding protein n=1 Tax=Spinactinospora alkalitolerans TaxID=687207 RepID=A0A852TZ93_9ACTN|nr:ABC transporter ATP-binding protein [Spinactinospora alkalitolerans]NYE48103.1 oligopeptide transport system ATP-binding protein [Spinactinospora alkalitolerans]
MSERQALVEAENLAKHFPIRRGVLRRTVGTVRAVDGVSFTVRRGETLGLVGESGSGKSTIGRVLLRLTEPTSGSVRFRGRDITALDQRPLRELRPRLQMVFQDSYSSLTPRLPVGAAVREPLDLNGVGTAAGRRTRVEELFDLVHLDRRLMDRLPHELSGGQRQRVGIARALACDPEFIVADEAIAALDVSIQAQIVNLLLDLQQELALTYLFITHDLAMARHVCDRIAVLYLGRVVEVGDAERVTAHPRHPYTRALLSAVPVADPVREATRRRVILRGEIPSPADPPPGCRFSTRCPYATRICRESEPELLHGEHGGEVACHHAGRLDSPPTPADA